MPGEPSLPYPWPQKLGRHDSPLAPGLARNVQARPAGSHTRGAAAPQKQDGRSCGFIQPSPPPRPRISAISGTPVHQGDPRACSFVCVSAPNPPLRCDSHTNEPPFPRTDHPSSECGKPAGFIP